MKTFKLLSCVFLAFLVSCSSDDQVPPNELEGLALVTEIQNDNHIVELYTSTGTLVQGYNPISIRIREKSTNRYQAEAAISWMPIMHMTSMQHSCPFSPIGKTPGAQTLYDGFIVFQMAENATEHWTLGLTYTIDETTYSATGEIPVVASSKQRVASVTAADGNRYVVAMAQPALPAVGLNEMAAVVYKMESMMSFVPVNGFTIKIDPRMPSMGNHGSPNNTDLVLSENLYRGTLSLTMTGYWKINLQLFNANNDLLKGEAVSPDHPESSLYFEVEF